MSCTLQDIHRVEFDMLSKLKNVCDKYNITYYLTYGTLLGAFKYKGFIPWDDDIDVMMPHDEIDRFKECFMKEYPAGYSIVSPYSDNIIGAWYKIRKDGTCSMPRKLKDIDIHWGICIDIFPIYKCGNTLVGNAMRKNLFKLSERLFAAVTAKYLPDASISLKAAAKIPGKIRVGMARAVLSILKRGCGEKYIFDGFMFMKSEDIMGKKREMCFENELFRVPTNSEAFLEAAYGDYMTPPPENERTGHESEAGEIIWDTQKGFENYR